MYMYISMYVCVYIYKIYIYIYHLSGPVSASIARCAMLQGAEQLQVDLWLIHTGDFAVHTGFSAVHTGFSAVHTVASAVHTGDSAVHIGDSDAHGHVHGPIPSGISPGHVPSGIVHGRVPSGIVSGATLQVSGHIHKGELRSASRNDIAGGLTVNDTGGDTSADDTRGVKPRSRAMSSCGPRVGFGHAHVGLVTKRGVQQIRRSPNPNSYLKGALQLLSNRHM